MPRRLLMIVFIVLSACGEGPSPSASPPTADTLQDAAADAPSQPADVPADTVAAPDVATADGALAEDASADAGLDAADVPPAPPSPKWQQLGPVPQVLWGSLLAPAGKPGVFLGFGGSGYPKLGVNDSTWTYATQTDQWSNQKVPGSPPPRYCHCLVAMPSKGQVLLVGGRNGEGPLAAGAWTYDVAQQTWQAVDGEVPQGTIGCHAGWLPDLDGGRAVVFGGEGVGVGMQPKTWLYDPQARAFTTVTPIHSPPGRRDGATASDVAGGRVLLFGGQTKGYPKPAHIADFWQFDGKDWQLVQSQGPMPSPRRYPGAAFDPVRRRWLLFSGTDEKQDFEDFWLFDAKTATWTALPMEGAPEVRSFAAFVYDGATDAYFLFGGAQSPAVKGMADGYRLGL